MVKLVPLSSLLPAPILHSQPRERLCIPRLSPGLSWHKEITRDETKAGVLLYSLRGLEIRTHCMQGQNTILKGLIEVRVQLCLSSAATQVVALLRNIALLKSLLS